MRKKIYLIIVCVVGLEFVNEIQKPNMEEYYMCYMCDATCVKTKIIEHVTGLNHKVRYIVSTVVCPPPPTTHTQPQKMYP